MEFYIWQDHRCVYDVVPGERLPSLLLIHPIGVGLSRAFWTPFIQQWSKAGGKQAIYNSDLLGCGESEMPRRAYRPKDWAEQIAFFIEQVVQGPVVLVVQGALLPVAVELMSLSAETYVQGLVLSGPPAWPLMTTPTAAWKTDLAWQLFASPLGNAFYRYARRSQFLKSFSERQLFDRPEDVTDGWLKMLNAGSRDMNSRYAVFSFLAGFWRQDYTSAIARIQQPVLIAMGKDATTIDRTVAQQEAKKEAGQPEKLQANGKRTAEANQKRLQDYLDHFPRAQGVNLPGRNVLPYESTEDFVKVVSSFVSQLAAS
ncbi:MAG: alpha/beta fold hydrolase [Cyanobacteria bacterium J06623_4]